MGSNPAPLTMKNDRAVTARLRLFCVQHKAAAGFAWNLGKH
ncbi:MAG: hypothetical protein R3297_10920 [Desulfobulbales bacterium]|nr:hypothetical protein [Desulfobulbales bacterium]